MLKCMEMFLFGGFPCGAFGAFGLQTDKIMNRELYVHTFIISITTNAHGSYFLPFHVTTIPIQ